MSRTCAVGKLGLSEGSPPRRAKSSGQRFPREVPFAGRRRRLADDAGSVRQTSRGRTAVEFSTFGHFPARTAGTGERGGRKSAVQRACALPAAARLLEPITAKCPKVAIPFTLDGKASDSLAAARGAHAEQAVLVAEEVKVSRSVCGDADLCLLLGIQLGELDAA